MKEQSMKLTGLMDNNKLAEGISRTVNGNKTILF
jgi:hypothetical protein